jgi:hypothetical protein
MPAMKAAARLFAAEPDRMVDAVRAGHSGRVVAEPSSMTSVSIWSMPGTVRRIGERARQRRRPFGRI